MLSPILFICILILVLLLKMKKSFYYTFLYNRRFTCSVIYEFGLFITVCISIDTVSCILPANRFSCLELLRAVYNRLSLKKRNGESVNGNGGTGNIRKWGEYREMVEHRGIPYIPPFKDL
jgi:hypothetical protein